MSSVNKVILVGYVGADAEQRMTGSGKAVTEFRMATTEKYGENETTEWHRVITWEKLAEIAGKFVKKGTLVYVEGRIQTRSFDDAEGNKRYVTEVVAREMRLLGPKPAEDEAPAEKPKRGRKPKSVSPVAEFGDIADERLPF